MRYFAVRPILAEDHNSFWLKYATRTAIGAHTFHIIVLLTERCNNTPADSLAECEAKNLVYPLLA